MVPSLGGVITMEAAQVAVDRWLRNKKSTNSREGSRRVAACSRQREMEAPLGLDLSGRWPVRSGGRPGAWPGWSWKPGLWFVETRCVPAGSLRSVMRHPRQPVGGSRPTGRRRTSLVGGTTQGFRHPEGACGDAGGSDGGPARRTGDVGSLLRQQQLATHRGSARAVASFGALCSAQQAGVSRLWADGDRVGQGADRWILVTRRTSTRAFYTTIDRHDAMYRQRPIR